jgi:hypothetical protein
VAVSSGGVHLEDLGGISDGRSAGSLVIVLSCPVQAFTKHDFGNRCTSQPAERD